MSKLDRRARSIAKEGDGSDEACDRINADRARERIVFDAATVRAHLTRAQTRRERIRDADTILSLSTRPLSTTSDDPTDATTCQTIPVTALADLDPSDALVVVVETSVTGLPDRRRATGIYDGEPERFYPNIGEVHEDWCLDRTRGRGDADMFYRRYPFTDAQRSFTVHVAVGSATTPSQQREVWQILDRLTFDAPASLAPEQTGP